VWEQRISPAHQRPRFLRHGVGQGRNLESTLAHRRVRQFAAGSKTIDFVQRYLQLCHSFGNVSLPILLDRKRQALAITQFVEA
jgi:hypothetical protein